MNEKSITSALPQSSTFRLFRSLLLERTLCKTDWCAETPTSDFDGHGDRVSSVWP